MHARVDFEGRPCDLTEIARIMGTGPARICRDIKSAFDKIRAEHPDLFKRLMMEGPGYSPRVPLDAVDDV